MTKCIICRLEKDNMSDEHVIPESLGGYYHIFNVCADCNSMLGAKVDAHLINNKFGEFYRSTYNLKGKTGNIPNPYEGTFSSIEDPERKSKFKRNEDGSFEPHLLPYIKIKKDENGAINQILIEVDESEKDSVGKLIEKILNRNGLKKSDIKKTTSGTVSNVHQHKITWSINLNEINLGALKIAYEFAVDSIPSYFNDKMATQISDVLFNADADKAKEYILIGDGFDKRIIEPFESIFDIEKNKHYLMLLNYDSKLFCLIIINCVYYIGIKLSDSTYFEFKSSIIGVNDVDNGTFNRLTLQEAFDVCMGPIEYTFYNKGEPLTLMEADFKPVEYPTHLFKKDVIPLYDKNKTPISTVHEVLGSLNPYDYHKGEVTKHSSSFSLPLKNHIHEYYIKSQSTGHIYPVDTIEIVQKWKGRI
ncbi:HNH endonuclease [Klebsiella pneumoniae]|uniref:HNH endonuclease n=3 Tax=Klebsiella pneumoniae complex TaxID=3390273 RepID=A0AAI8IUR3_9ENTR|nr:MULTISPECIES: HNH endonuclease [Klebsiella]AWL57448.1 HNH endonuclease [Klebsiella quasipneumoniae]AWL63161.1 HNH endonuclease [Klebsiella quasipneumoniae]AWL75389.1 HNH endonuclease [Klebsiella quasipneumoniae]KMI89021.1 hypothetical protein SN00_03583 [Klebsiella pneumoniae]MBW7053819.1 HNH endonuclease [Klebsiella pneumoniae]